MNIKSLILICIIILFSFSSLAKVGDRYNCNLTENKFIGKNFHGKFEIMNETMASKLLLATILPNDKVKIEHEKGTNIWSLKKVDISEHYPLKYKGIKIYSGKIFHVAIKKINDNNKWTLRFISFDVLEDFSSSYSLYNCMLLQ